MAKNGNGQKDSKKFDEKRCGELVAAGATCEEIAGELGFDPDKFRRTLQAFVARKMHEDKQFYEVKGLYKDSDNGYKEKPLKWSEKRGITLSPLKIPEKLREKFVHQKTTFEIQVQGTNLLVIPSL